MQKYITRFGVDLPAAYVCVARVNPGKESGIAPDVKVYASHDQAVTDVGLPDVYSHRSAFETLITGNDPIGQACARFKALPDCIGAVEA